MMEMMEAVDIEKQKHNNTRMEALARLAKLETVNADLARCLATAQWNLEVEVNRVAELREQTESRETAHEELQRRIATTQQTGTSIDNSMASKGVKLEHEMLVAEYSFVTDKVEQLNEKVGKLKANIESTRKEMEHPTEVEVELKRRLAQLTDHLIQKQSQVEALSSEKAMLLFRIEAVSRLLDENKPAVTMIDLSSSSQEDLTTGTWQLSRSQLKPMFEDKIRTGQQHLRSLLRQLDTIFSAGSVLLRRNPTAKLLSLIYLVCLHFWVLYILFAHPSSSNKPNSGAVISLENINNSSGV
ncbi:Ras- protein Rab-11A [Ancistrocladus abbreviatus]